MGFIVKCSRDGFNCNPKLIKLNFRKIFRHKRANTVLRKDTGNPQNLPRASYRLYINTS